jgi:predicted metal-dependent hydrolase
MQGAHSPQFSTSGKHDLFHKQRSPSFRSKRIPSVQEHLLCSSNQNIKTCKQDSPSKLSEEIKRRRSHYAESNQLSHSGNKKKARGQSKNDTNAQNIINSIHDLKEEYRTLREAYKGLIGEKVKQCEEMAKLKEENGKLKEKLDEIVQEKAFLKDELTSARQ